MISWINAKIRKPEDIATLIKREVEVLDGDVRIERSVIRIFGDLILYCDMIVPHVNLSVMGDIFCPEKRRNIETKNLHSHDILNVGNIKTNELQGRKVDTLDLEIDTATCKTIAARNICYVTKCIAMDNFSCESIEGIADECEHKCEKGEIVIRKK